MNTNPAKRKKRLILFLAANPKDSTPLRLAEELKEIEAGLRRSQKRDKFQLEQQWAVTVRDMQRAVLDHEPQVVHFSGHGAGEAGLVLQDESGQAYFVETGGLAGLFELFAEQVECVLLNACYSKVQAKAIAQHIPYVIGMSQAVGDTAAREFAVGFYDALGAGKPYEFAYKFGCNSIRMAGIPEHLTPVLLTKSSSEVTAPTAALEPISPPPAAGSTAAQAAASTPAALQSIEVFFSYSHRDEELRDELALHLSMLKRQGVIRAWHDREISAGSEWAGEIDQKLDSANIILLLISANFLASDYCYDIEMQRAMERHEAGAARVIPIILKPVDWSGAPFSKLQALPKNAKPITTWDNRDEAFLNVAQGIRRAAQAFSTAQSSEKSETRRENSPDDSTSSKNKSQGLVTATRSEVGFLPTQPISLDLPEGSVSLDSSLYIERPPIELDCYATIVKPGALIRVKAPRQMGKSSLMQRILHHAKQQDYQTASINFQMAEAETLANIDSFLQWFCAVLTDELNLTDKVLEMWKKIVGSKRNCTNYFQRYLLQELKFPLALGLDEVDQVFQYPETAQEFFGLLRTWHEQGKNEDTWKKLRLIIVHSKEVYIPLNINQSPFNVGLPIELPELNREQVEDLVQRHGLAWSDFQIDQLMGVVDGHPYLLRKALYEIARDNLSLEKFVEVAYTEEGPYEDHLRRHLLNLQSDPALEAVMRQVVVADGPVRLESSPAFKLRSMGLVELRGNDVIPLCNLYRVYFRDRLGGSS